MDDRTLLERAAKLRQEAAQKIAEAERLERQAHEEYQKWRMKMIEDHNAGKIPGNYLAAAMEGSGE
jgi:hypothetical protein